ncbi:MAG: PPC domain-containing protein [Thermoanaerobaculia bacterium]
MKTTPMLLTLVLALGAAAAGAETFEGSLSNRDQTRPDGQHFDTYTFEAQAGQLVTVRMESDGFDTYLIVESPSGEASENDDHSSGGSQVDLIVAEAGEWTIKASSYGSDASGEYTVTVDKGAVGQVEKSEGRLDARDQSSIKGEYYDIHEMQLRPGSQAYVELRSLGFDGYLAIRSPSGQLWRNDDAGSVARSLLGPLDGEAGNWTVYVTSVGAEEVGAYDLNIIRY